MSNSTANAKNTAPISMAMEANHADCFNSQDSINAADSYNNLQLDIQIKAKAAVIIATQRKLEKVKKQALPWRGAEIIQR